MEGLPRNPGGDSRSQLTLTLHADDCNKDVAYNVVLVLTAQFPIRRGVLVESSMYLGNNEFYTRFSPR